MNFRLAILSLSALLGVYPGIATSASPAPPLPPPLLIDLDHFDALKKSVTLPNGQLLAYIDIGDTHGKPVVLIHGYTDNARDWVPLLPYLSQKDRLIIVDIRGHGQSAKPECCYARLDFAYDIKLLLDVLKIKRADVIGHSLGSIITQTLAEYWPERVSRVVLISSTGGPRKGAAPKPPSFDFLAEIRKLKEPIDPDSPFMIACLVLVRRKRHDTLFSHTKGKDMLVSLCLRFNLPCACVCIS